MPFTCQSRSPVRVACNKAPTGAHVSVTHNPCIRFILIAPHLEHSILINLVPDTTGQQRTHRDGAAGGVLKLGAALPHRGLEDERAGGRLGHFEDDLLLGLG